MYDRCFFSCGGIGDHSVRRTICSSVSASTDGLQPNHLLGIGDPKSIDLCLPMGFDTFDSAFPTRAARHGTIFTRYSKG